jgi:hypothetical protein
MISATFSTGCGQGSDISTDGDTINLENLHIDGPGANTMGPKKMIGLVKQFGKSRGANTVKIKGGTRTTGARAGKNMKPKEIEVKVND